MTLVLIRPIKKVRTSKLRLCTLIYSLLKKSQVHSCLVMLATKTLCRGMGGSTTRLSEYCRVKVLPFSKGQNFSLSKPLPTPWHLVLRRASISTLLGVMTAWRLPSFAVTSSVAMSVRLVVLVYQEAEHPRLSIRRREHDCLLKLRCTHVGDRTIWSFTRAKEHLYTKKKYHSQG
jgi:hypothetical protein